MDLLLVLYLQEKSVIQAFDLNPKVEELVLTEESAPDWSHLQGSVLGLLLQVTQQKLSRNK